MTEGAEENQAKGLNYAPDVIAEDGSSSGCHGTDCNGSCGSSRSYKGSGSGGSSKGGSRGSGDSSRSGGCSTSSGSGGDGRGCSAGVRGSSGMNSSSSNPGANCFGSSSSTMGVHCLNAADTATGFLGTPVLQLLLELQALMGSFQLDICSASQPLGLLLLAEEREAVARGALLLQVLWLMAEGSSESQEQQQQGQEVLWLNLLGTFHVRSCADPLGKNNPGELLDPVMHQCLSAKTNLGAGAVSAVAPCRHLQGTCLGDLMLGCTKRYWGCMVRHMECGLYKG